MDTDVGLAVDTTFPEVADPCWSVTPFSTHDSVVRTAPPYSKRVKLSWIVEQLCQRVSKLQYMITVITQVGRQAGFGVDDVAGT